MVITALSRKQLSLRNWAHGFESHPLRQERKAMNKIVKNQISKGIVFTVIVIAFAVSLMVMLKYKTEGETNMPFKLKKILTVSSIEAEKNPENPENFKWNLNLNQYNDIYIEIEKNAENKEEGYIESITLENFYIDRGNVELYMPSSKEEKLFSYEEGFKINGSLTYRGASETNQKALNIANQGGTILFRAVNKNIGKFQSNEGEEISYDGKLLQKIKINGEDLKYNISFDIIIITNNNSYKGTYQELLPAGDLIKDGVAKKTEEDLKKIIFKRIV